MHRPERLNALNPGLIAELTDCGGMALALASDVRLVTPDARMNAAFTRVGLSGWSAWTDADWRQASAAVHQRDAGERQQRAR